MNVSSAELVDFELDTSKRDIIRAHPELSPREIRKRYGISVNHVRVERANGFTKRKTKPGEAK